MKLSSISLPLLLLLTVSCASQTIVFAPDRELEHQDFVISELERLSEGESTRDLLDAAALLSREQFRAELPLQDRVAALDRIIEGYRALLPGDSSADRSAQTPRDAGDIFNEYTLLQNYRLLLSYRNEIEPSPEGSFAFDSADIPQMSGLFLSAAEYHRSAGEGSLALFYFSQAAEELGESGVVDAGLEKEALDFYSEEALRHNNRKLLAVLLSALERNYPLDTQSEPYGSYRRYLEAPWEAQIGVDASVTVWVDKGIRVQNRVGFPERSIGTAFYVDSRGYLITNYHVIASEVDPEYEGRSELFIRPGENPDLRIPARVVGYDRVFDIALLKVEGSARGLLSFQNGDALRSGSQLFAVGSPGGLENSVTSGIVSAAGRRFLQLGDSLQIDAPVNPGNSGGPLFDRQGNLIGVVFAGIEQFEGVNFAIPSSWITLIYPRLFDGGEVQHPWLGLALREDASGLEVLYVSPDSPAYRAGFAVGDVITSIDGADPGRIPDAQRRLLRGGMDRLYRIEGFSSDQEKFIRLAASGRRPHIPLEAVLDERRLVDSWLPPLFGMQVESLSRRTRLSEYVITDVYPGGIADESGLSENDPFQLIDWFFDPEQNIAVLQIIIQKRSGGYLREGLQLANFIELNSFL